MEFLCGKLYDDIDEEMLENALNKNDKYSVFFSEYLTFAYTGNIDSIMTQWNLYNSGILPFEKMFGKYLWQMTVAELKEMIMSIPSNSYAIKSNTFTMAEQYLNWCIGYKHLITINNMKILKKEDVIKLNAKAIQMNLCGIESFWKLINKMSIKVDEQALLPIVLSRYGLNDLKRQASLTYKSIDRENKKLIVENEDGSKNYFEIDDRFIDFIDKAEEVDGYYEDGHLVKSKHCNAARSKHMIMGKVKKACDYNDIEPIKLTHMYQCKVLDRMLEIRKTRKLSTRDFQNLLLEFDSNASVGKYSNLVKWYEAVANDKVLGGWDKVQLDPNGEQFVSEFKERLNYY